MTLTETYVLFLDVFDAKNEDSVYSAVMRRMSREPIPPLKKCSNTLFDIISRAVNNTGYEEYKNISDMKSELKAMMS